MPVTTSAGCRSSTAGPGSVTVSILPGGTDVETGCPRPSGRSLTGNPGPPNTIVVNSVDGLSERAPHEGSATPVTAAPNRLVAAFAAGQSPRSRPHTETLHMRHVHAPASLVATTLARTRPATSTSVRFSTADSPSVSVSMAPRSTCASVGETGLEPATPGPP